MTRTRPTTWPTLAVVIGLHDLARRCGPVEELVDGYLETPCGLLRKFSIATGLTTTFPFRTASIVAPVREECGWQP